MNMQQLMMQAQRMQRELQKAQAELAKKEFSVNKNGMITVSMLGNKQITKIDIDEDALEKDNKELIEELLQSAINELIEQVNNEEEAINSKLQSGVRMGL